MVRLFIRLGFLLSVLVLSSQAGLALANGEIELSATTYSVNENGGSIRVQVNRVNGSNGAVSVWLETINGTAEAGVDYTAKNLKLDFGNGVISRDVTIPVSDNSAYSGNKLFIVHIYNPEGGAIINTKKYAQITIAENEAGPDYSKLNTNLVINGEGNSTAYWSEWNGKALESNGDVLRNENGGDHAGSYQDITIPAGLNYLKSKSQLYYNAVTQYRTKDGEDAILRLEQGGVLKSNITGNHKSEVYLDYRLLTIGGKSASTQMGTSASSCRVLIGGNNNGNWVTNLDVFFNYVRLYIKDLGNPTLISTKATAGTYLRGTDVYFAVRFNELVELTGGATLQLTSSGAIRQASYVGGSGSEALLFKYTVRADDNSRLFGSLKSEGIILSSGSVLTDHSGNAAMLRDVGHDLEDHSAVQLDGRIPTVSFSPAGNTSWLASTATRVTTVSDGGSQKYAWTTNTQTPTTGWTAFNSADNIALTSETGTYYLHISATHSNTYTVFACSNGFNIDNEGPTVFTPSFEKIGTSAMRVSGSTSDNLSGIHSTSPYQFAIDGVYTSWGSNVRKTYFNLKSNKAYSFKMRARDNLGNITETSTITEYTNALPPSAELIASSSTQLSFSITQNPDNDAEPICSYMLRTRNGTLIVIVGEIANTTNTLLTFSELTAGTSYDLWAIPQNGDNTGINGYPVATNAVTNRIPVAVNDSYSTYKRHQLSVSAPGILFNDTDADNNSLSAVLLTEPSAAQGTISLNANGSFTFTPADGFLGNASFTYQVNDGHENSLNTATVTISVVTPTWNGNGLHTTVANWNGNEVPIASDDVLIKSGLMNVNSAIEFNEMVIGGAQVIVGAEGMLKLKECTYSGDILKAENGGAIIINGNISSSDDTKLEIESGVLIKSGIKLSVPER